MLSKQTQNIYSMRATGRVNCIGLQALLKLKRRHDIFLKLWDHFTKAEDSVVIDIAIPKMDPMVFVVVPTKSEKSYKKSNKDVEVFASSRNELRAQVHFPECFSILADSEEVVQGLLVPKVVKAITDYKDYIEVIHFTDAWNHSKYSKVLRFVFKLPTDDMEKLHSLTTMSLFFIDQIASFNLPSQTFDKLSKWRNKIVAAALKPKPEDLQEAMQKRQEEKRRKEQEKYEQMTPEQKAKEDQRRSKKEAKKKSQGQRFKVAYG
uniref:DUF1682 domain-containing protein n=1 Tax=Arcella intermedia TaxID=1963864 RepID=A0A6B2L779_9EUKA